MATDTTLRNMGFIFMIMQDGFVEGSLEYEYTDSKVNISNKIYYMEAKSVYMKDSIKKASSYDLGQALAQINMRSEENAYGVIVTNQKFFNYQDDFFDSYKLNEIDDKDLNIFFKSQGFESKINSYKKNQKLLDNAKLKRLRKYFVLIIDGKNDEEIRGKMSIELMGYLNNKNIDFNNRRITPIIDISDKILNSIAEEKNKSIKLEAFTNWFKIRKNDSSENVKYDNIASELFENERKLDIAIRNFNNKKSLYDLNEENFNIYISLNIDDFKDYLKGFEKDETETINNHKVNWLLINGSGK